MPSEVRYAQVKRMLESRGYALHRINGSHHMFKKPGIVTFVVPVHRGKVKPAYVRQIEKLP